MMWKAGLIALVLLAALGPQEGERINAKTYQMEVLGVAADPHSGQPMVILRGKEEKRHLTMFIGPFEAQSIAMSLQGVHPPRPLTHDLMVSVLGKLRTKLKKVVITELRESTFYALLHLEQDGGEMTVDSRPSDAIALALRADAPIFAEEPAFPKEQPKGEVL